MQSIDTVKAPGFGEFQGEQDLGPLAWVLDELRKSLDGAVKSLRRFVYEADLGRGGDLAALDTSPLRLARQQLHQVGGALEMVGMAAPAMVLRTMESAVQKFVQRPEMCTDEAAEVLERASFALGEYLDNVLAGKTVSAVALFPQYRDVQDINGVNSVHPADLWPVERRFREPELVLTLPALPYGPAARARLDQAVLKIVKGADTGAARELRDVCLELAASQDSARLRAFWKIGAGFFEAFSLNLFKPDVYVKRVASRILMQYASLAKGDPTLTERLVQDLLFFCAQADAVIPGQAPALEAVRKVFALERFPAVDYEARRFGRFDPAALAQARKRIAAAAETWAALAGGDRNKFKQTTDQFSLVCDSLRRLQRSSEGLALALTRAVDQTVAANEPPSASLAMEVATSVLYLQAALEELDTPPEQLAQRAQRLAQRLDRVSAGAEPDPLESWMEELYRHFSDRQTMGSVVGELRSTLGEAERAMDQFFRDPQNTVSLATVPTFLGQMRGVLSVLGLDQASLAVARMSETVEHLLSGQISGASERQQTFEKLGNSLGTLGFMVDMLSYQRTLARRLFVYDETLGELRSLMGRDRVREGDALQEQTVLREQRSGEVLPVVQAPLAEQPPAFAVPAGEPAQQPSAAPQSQQTPAIPDLPALTEPMASFEALPPAATPVPDMPVPDTSVADTHVWPDLLPVADTAALPASPAQPASLPSADAEPLQTPAGMDGVLQDQAPGIPSDETAPATAMPVLVSRPALAIDDELLEIFLEEVREVESNGRTALDLLQAEPGNLSEQTTLRRAFHTLKGSSRMVGLNEFGEAAWSMEQLLNAWLAEQKPMHTLLMQLAGQALQGFARWADAIAVGDAGAWQATAFVRAAEALQQGSGQAVLVLPPAVGASGQAEQTEQAEEMQGAGRAEDAPLQEEGASTVPAQDSSLAIGEARAALLEDALASTAAVSVNLPDAEDGRQSEQQAQDQNQANDTAAGQTEEFLLASVDFVDTQSFDNSDGTDGQEFLFDGVPTQPASQSGSDPAASELEASALAPLADAEEIDFSEFSAALADADADIASMAGVPAPAFVPAAPEMPLDVAGPDKAIEGAVDATPAGFDAPPEPVESTNTAENEKADLPMPPAEATDAEVGALSEAGTQAQAEAVTDSDTVIHAATASEQVDASAVSEAQTEALPHALAKSQEAGIPDTADAWPGMPAMDTLESTPESGAVADEPANPNGVPAFAEARANQQETQANVDINVDIGAWSEAVQQRRPLTEGADGAESAPENVVPAFAQDAAADASEPPAQPIQTHDAAADADADADVQSVFEAFEMADAAGENQDGQDTEAPAAQTLPESGPALEEHQPELPDAEADGFEQQAFGPEEAVDATAELPMDTVPAAEDACAMAGDTEDFSGAELQQLRDDDSTKTIGSLRIGTALYNVYLNEAEEWSRSLDEVLQEWSLRPALRVPDAAIALAHSMAGSSATVGFTDLSSTARLLENALAHVQLQQLDLHTQIPVFAAASEDMRRLLHQFAAGFLKEANALVQQELREILATDVGVAPAHTGLEDLMEQASAAEEHAEGTGAPDWAASAEEATLAQAPTAFTAASESAIEEVPAWVSASDSGVAETPAWVSASGPEPETASEFGTEPENELAAVFSELPAPAAAAGQPQEPAVRTTLYGIGDSTALTGSMGHLVGDVDDDIDVLDVIDPDLFQFFEDEALELLPNLGGALRQWVAQPDHGSARSEVLRALHTLKGSSRLAGAMRLGEMAHRMESAIEELDAETVRSQDLEPLLANFDSLQANFEVLRAVSAKPQSALQPEMTVPATAFAAAGLRVAGVEAASLRATSAAPAPAALPRTVARPALLRVSAGQSVRVRAQLLDRLVNQAGEVMITRSRLEARLGQLKGSMTDLSGNLERLRQQLRDIEVQSESQMQSRLALSRDSGAGFDPLEFDRFTRVQELTRMMAESVNDVATVQRNLQRAIDGTEDELVAQGRQARELQRDLLRTRMVEFEGISERLYAVVRQSSKETGKQIKLEITGGAIEMDRGVLDRMTPAFEHLLRNCVAHGIEAPEVRQAADKPAAGTITVALKQEGNDVSVEFRDDGAGLDVARIRAKAVEQGLVAPDAHVGESEAAQLIFAPGFTTASVVSEISGRGIGMDVVRSEVNALGGRVETTTRSGQGSSFRMVLPLTTAVTQVVMLRMGKLSMGVPASLIDIVRRVPEAEVQAAYESGSFMVGDTTVPFHWAGQLLQSSRRSNEAAVGKTLPVVVLRSASQRIAMHVDEVLGNQEVVVKNLGPQLARLPGLAGMSVLASGAVVLIYNPVALSTVYAEQLRTPQSDAAGKEMPDGGAPGMPLPLPVESKVPLVLVVDDSITVRRVTQRLLQREGYRVVLAADGLQALERLQDERPAVVLSDIEMPRMDGFDLARNIRADAVLGDLPIIMITSRIAQKHREHAMELGVNHYLGKPYSDEELLSLVQHYSKLATEAVAA